MAEFVKGTIKKQPSLMMVVPINVENIINPEFIYYNLKNSKEFDKVYFYFNEKKKQPGIKIKYDGDEYNISFCIENFNINQNFFNLTHCISQKNIDALRKAPLGVMTSMIFGSSPVKSYFLQLKVLNCIAPDSAGIIDFSAEKIYSPIWANMACESSAAPSLTYIYSIQAVSDNKNVWLHTHGLKRCGFLELEILASSKKNYISHSDMLNEMAISVISNNNLPNELEPIFVASLPSGEVIVNTWLSYKKGIKMYEKNILGSGKNRKHFHDKNSALIFNYPNKSYYKKNTPVKISDLDDNFFNNPLVMRTNEETKRMSVLAGERYNFLEKYFNISNEVEASVKARLKVDENKIMLAGGRYEHIWLNVSEINGEKLSCRLIQEPFYIAGIHAGDNIEVNKEDISDWKMFYKGNEITPDSCYTLVEGIINIAP